MDNLGLPFFTALYMPRSTPRPKPTSTPTDTDSEAQNGSIWLAGMGAFAQAQAQGNQAFDALVQEGLRIQRETQAAAQARLAEMGQLAQQANQLSADPDAPASGQWNRLSGLFEDRVGQAMARMGMPSVGLLQAQAVALAELSARVEALEARLNGPTNDQAASDTALAGAGSSRPSPVRPARTARKASGG